jgi:SAM-dependent methyltransferase
MSSGQVNKTLVKLIIEEPLAKFAVLDVGCGTGALSFIVAEKAGKVIGIDISKGAISEARQRSTGNTSFFVVDADTADYTALGEVDMIVSHLCMSDRIIENSARALLKGKVFAFACFHTNHLIEGGRRSRFSYTEGEMRQILEKAGFTVEYLEVETDEILFSGIDEAIEIIGGKNIRRWKKDGRFQNLQDFIVSGGRTLTKSILIGKARKI